MILDLFKRNSIDKLMDELIVDTRLEEILKKEEKPKEFYSYIKKLVKEDIKEGKITEEQIPERINYHVGSILLSYVYEDSLSLRERNDIIRKEYEERTEFEYNVYFKFIYVKFLHDLSKKYKYKYENYGMGYGTNFDELKKHGINDKFLTEDMHVSDEGIKFVKENEYIMIYHNLSSRFAISNPYYYSRLLFFNPLYHEKRSKKIIYEILLGYSLHLEKHYGEKTGKYENLEYKANLTSVLDYKDLVRLISFNYEYLKQYDKALEYNIKFMIRYFTDVTVFNNKFMIYALERSIYKEIKHIYDKLGFENSKDTYEIYFRAYNSLKIPTHIGIGDCFKYWCHYIDTGILGDKIFDDLEKKYSYMSKIR